MKNFLTCILALCAVLLAMPAAHCSEKTLTVCQPAEPSGLDPTSNTAAAIDRVVYSNIYEGLIKIDRNGSYIPGLAKRWTVSEDGKIYTFYLAKNVIFHNKEPFNSKTVKWNIIRAAGDKSINPHPEYFRGIKDITLEGDYIVRLSLKEPDSLFIPHLAEGDAVMLPLKGYENAKAEPIGTGPFKFVKWDRGDKIEIEKFDQYRNPDIPYLDKVVFKFIEDPSSAIAALKAGDIDVIGWISAPQSAKQLARDKRFKVYAGTTTGEVIMSINNKVAPFDNVLVRRAIASAIDKKTLIDLAMFGYGTPIGSHWAPSAPYYIDLTQTFPYSVEKAKAMLAEAGYPNGFEAVIKVPVTYSYAKPCAEVIADMLAKAGIKLKIEMIQWGQWIERVFKNKEYQLTIIGHVEPWDIGIYANPNYYFQYDSKVFQDAYSKALRASYEKEKALWFGNCQKIIAMDAVNAYLFSAPNLPAMKTDVMGWWENYPTAALDCTGVWLKPEHHQ